MRAVILGLAVFALGLASAALVSPRAGAHTAAGSLSGSVGPGFSISMSASSVTPGSYTISVSDSSNAHNFHFFGPGVDQKTSITGTGSASWSVTLQAGTYTFQCDAHASSMNGTLSVADVSTTTTDTTTSTTTPTTTTTTTTPTTTARTTTQRTTTEATTSEQTTTEAETTTEAAQTTTAEPETTKASTTTQAALPALHARVASAHATTRTVAITVVSNQHGTALAQLYSGAHRVAETRGAVPGKLVLRPARPLRPGRYTVKLRVTAGGTSTTSRRVVTVP